MFGTRHRPGSHAIRRRGLHPAQAVTGGFTVAIVIGTILLALPVSAAGPEGIGIGDALFTAVSAVCVTGLTVIDTQTAWSPFGQVIIMGLIQIGGLGIMVFASLIGLALARKLTVRGRANAVSEAKILGSGDVRSVLRGIVVTSLLIEAAVFVPLWIRFLSAYDHSPASAAWHAMFHAVSSFNNAGFALYSNNLIGFATDPFILLPLAVATILGGLGFPVLMQLRREFRRPLHWSLNTNLVIAATAVLLISGWIYITAIEWSNPNTFGPFSTGGKLLAGFFASVQTRTSGFNAVDIGAMNDTTWFGMDILMFIGGGPAGTAGGIKVTTFAVLGFIMWAEFRGAGAVNIFGKRLSRAVHRQAITVALTAVGAVVVSTVALMLASGNSLDRSLFESISAFGTVGLSTGITGSLSQSSELILIVLMFLGRVGPLTLGTALALRPRRILYELPKESPVIG